MDKQWWKAETEQHFTNFEIYIYQVVALESKYFKHAIKRCVHIQNNTTYQIPSITMSISSKFN